MKTIDVLGYKVSNLGLNKNVDYAIDIIEKGKNGYYMACANPHSIVEAESDDFFSEALHNANLLLPDGAGIILAGKINGLSVNNRVAGNDFFISLCEKSKDRKLKFYFLGSTDIVLNLIKNRLLVEYPNIEVVGIYSPPFKSEFTESENQLMLDMINDAQPDVLWVGMTAPKQEKWIYKNQSKLEVPLSGAIGAVFDFYAGTKYRAPEWACTLGIEWLPRFLKEPRRLWRRNLISSPRFVYLVVSQRLGFIKKDSPLS